MATFVYKGLNSDGAVVDGRVSAVDTVDAMNQLEAQSIAPFELKLARAEDRKFERQKARPQDRHRFARQLAVLLKAGTPLLTAFEIIGSEETCRDLALQIAAIRRDLRSGTRLSTSINAHLTGFPEFVPRLIELGEATGELPRALNDIARQMEQDLKAAGEIRNALAYPAFLAVMGIVSVLFIFLFVVPRFATLLGDDRSAMPFMSRAVIETGVFLRGHMLESGFAVGGLILVIVMLFQNRSVRSAVHEFLFAVPVVGDFLKSSEIARWSRIAGTALSGGAPLLEALGLAEAALTSRKWRQGLIEARRAIRSGVAMEDALRTHTDFDAMTVNLVKTGRAAASLDEMLLFVADMYETESQNRAKRLTTLAEPIAVLFIASIIGTIVVSLVLAMTSLYDIAL